MIRLILAVTITIVFTANGFAAINTQRPRLWLNSAKVKELKAYVPVTDGGTGTVASPQWTTLKTWCDKNLYTETGEYIYSGYHGWQWSKAMLNYALAYALTGNETYGDEAVVYLAGLLYDRPNDSYDVRAHIGITDPSYTSPASAYAYNSTPRCAFDSGYATRIYANVAMARDWLDGTSALTSTIIKDIVITLGDCVSYIDAGTPYATNIPEDNYWAGHFRLIYMTAIGLYGDSGYQTSWKELADSWWDAVKNDLLEDRFDGGAHLEGWNYGPLASINYIGYPVALSTGTDESVWSETNWNEDTIKGHLHMLYPSRDHFFDNGKWSGDVKGEPAYNLISFLLAQTPLSSDLQQKGQWYINNISTTRTVSEWESLLNYTNFTPRQPTSTNMGGVLYTNDSGEGISRAAGWADTDETLITVVNNPYNAGAKSSQNGGEVTIFSRGEPLLTNGNQALNAPTQRGFLQQSALVTGTHTYSPIQEGWIGDRAGFDAPELLADGNDDTFAYFQAKNLEDLYNGNEWRTYPADTANYQRHVVYVKPDIIVIYDNLVLTTGDGTSRDCKFRWWWKGQPSVNGQVVTYRGTNAKLFMTILGQTGRFTPPATAASLGYYSYWAGTYYSDFEPSNDPVNNQTINVFEVGDIDATRTVPTYLTGTNVKGTVVDGNAVIFPSATNGTEIANASYTTNATKHYVAGLPVNVDVAVTRGGSEIATSPINSGKSGVIEFSAQAGSANYKITAGSPTCASDYNLCLSETTCKSAGWNWCDGACQNTKCESVTLTCSDGIQNNNETGIDCGGDCPECSNNTNELLPAPIIHLIK